MILEYIQSLYRHLPGEFYLSSVLSCTTQNVHASRLNANGSIEDDSYPKTFVVSRYHQLSRGPSNDTMHAINPLQCSENKNFLIPNLCIKSVLLFAESFLVEPHYF